VSAQALASEAELFPLRRAYQFETLGQQRAAWGNESTPNPPYGAILTYHVGPNFSGNLVVNITNDQGQQVRRLDVPETAGINRFAWNLRSEAPAGAPAGGGRGGGAGGGAGGGGGAGAAANVDPELAAQQAAAAAAAQGGRGGRGGGGGPAVNTGRYTAQLGKLSGDTFTPVGKAQSFQVMPLPAKNY
jgi:hypothetical protein